MKHIGTHLTDNGKVYIYNKFPSGYELRCSRCGRKTSQNQLDNSLLEEEIKVTTDIVLTATPTIEVTSDPIKMEDINNNPRFLGQRAVAVSPEAL